MMQSKIFMKKALEQAFLALENNEVPVGAVIVFEKKIIASAYNQMLKNQTALDHAELLCIKEASKILGTSFLIACDLYVTLEPCAMCAGAIANSKIKRLYFGAYDTKGGFVDHHAKIFNYTMHKPEIYGGILEQESVKLLQDFFHQKRTL